MSATANMRGRQLTEFMVGLHQSTQPHVLLGRTGPLLNMLSPGPLGLSLLGAAPSLLVP